MTNPALAPTLPQRLLSLDVLRGITIAFMIMVNNNGGPGSWKFMNHAPWNGFTPTDLVFPTFLFVVGASIVFAFESRLRRSATRKALAIHTVQRAAILFVLGVVVNGFPFFQLDHLRIYGVLQRIAVCYLIVGLFYLWDQRLWTKVAALGVALIGYWVLLRWVPVPGLGTPGVDFPFMDESRNLVSWLDRLLMPHHLYLNWPGPGVTDPHDLRDPEGLLSDLPALGTALLGMITALWLRAERSVAIKAVGLTAGSAACLLAGYAWALEFPLNKNLWTSSFVLVAAGWSLFALRFIYFAVDQRGWATTRIGKIALYPWLVLGSNAIVAYMFSELVPGLLDRIAIPTAPGRHQSLLDWVTSPLYKFIPDPGWAAFSFSVFTLVYCFVPVWILYRKKIFVKV